jgi:hypothetical protein
MSIRNKDPDPSYHFDADPDPTFDFDSDSDPTFHLSRIRSQIMILIKKG